MVKILNKENTILNKFVAQMRDKVVPLMRQLRADADELETVVGREYWPMPTYGDLLYYL